MIDTYIKQFEQLLTSDRISGKNVHEEELMTLFLQIAETIGQDYDTYHRYFPAFVKILEKHLTTSILYGLKNFENVFWRLVNELQRYPFDSSLIELETNTEIAERANRELLRVFSEGKQPRISDPGMNFSFFTFCEKRLAAAAYIHVLESRISAPLWETSDFQTTHMLLLPLHQLLKEIDQADMFYYNVSSLLDRFAGAEIFQATRNLLEEVIVTSFKDNEVDLGFLVGFRVYASGKKPSAALLAACTSIIWSLKNRKNISGKHLSQLLIQSVKFFRNINFYPWAIRFYEQRPSDLNLSLYEQRTLDHIYYSILLQGGDNRLPDLILDYLNQEREAILLGGKREAMPWLILLLQVQRHFSLGDYSAKSLDLYLKIFESIVPPQEIQKYRDMIFADSENIKNYLKQAIAKLGETLYQSDFVYDNAQAILYSNRCLIYSFQNRDASGFLLSMILKADYSLLFKSKEIDQVVPFFVLETDIQHLNDQYDNLVKLVSGLCTQADTIIWLGISGGKLYQLTFHNQVFSFHQPHNWNEEEFKKLKKDNYFAQLKFTKSIKFRGRVQTVNEETQRQEEVGIIERMKGASLFIPKQSKSLYIIKDMDLSFIPHNLFLDTDVNFVSKMIPVTNVMSTEWLLAREDNSLPSSFSKSVWIPTESNDITILALYSYLQESLSHYQFDVSSKIQPLKPLSSDLNIVCAHGADNIPDLQAFHFEDKLTLNLEAVVGPGKILILWVCHSGAAVKPLFKNETANLVKRFIAQGYEAVIAPAWALHVKIPSIWLPEFLARINTGTLIDQAVYYANKEVERRYPSPAAWANLHLYGNPKLKIGQFNH